MQTIRQEMTAVLDRLTRGYEDVDTNISGLGLFRRESTTEPCECIVEPSVVLVTQGKK